MRADRGHKSLLKNRRGMAAVEFALILPALVVLMMGVMEMSFRFRAKEEAVRYVHQVADLVARENTLTTAELDQIYDAALYMMTPVQTQSQLDLDVSSVGYGPAPDQTPRVFWRRIAGGEIPIEVADVAGMGVATETVIRVAVRYRYASPLTAFFGQNMAIIEEAVTRPREVRVITIDGNEDENGAKTPFGA